MLQSDTPVYRRISLSRVRYSKASSGVRMSGSLTISASGVPQRFRVEALPFQRCVSQKSRHAGLLPASSSRCRRVIPIFFVDPSAVGTSIQPRSAMGLSNCEIW